MADISHILERVSALAPHGQVVVDVDHKIVLWNAWMQEASGQNNDDTLGTRIEDAFADISERVSATLSQCLTSGASSVLSRASNPHPFPLRNRQFRDRSMSQSVTMSGFQASDGERYCLVNIVDVSHEVQREEALREKHRELELFTTMVGHDLRAPLRAVLRFSEMLSEDLGDDLTEDVAQDLRFIMEGGRRLDDLVEAILRLAKMEQIKTKRSTFPLSEVVDRATLDLAEDFGSVKVAISTDRLPEVFADRKLLIQLFQNLIGNAAKFIVEKAPKIQITVEELDGEHVFGVRDNGVGIDPGRSEEIFEPFRRLHAASQFEGCGIGLSICRKVVDRHGGKIWFDTECSDGAHVKFTLGQKTLVA